MYKVGTSYTALFRSHASPPLEAGHGIGDFSVAVLRDMALIAPATVTFSDLGSGLYAYGMEIEQAGPHTVIIVGIDGTVVYQETFLATAQGLDDVAQDVPLGLRPVEFRVKDASASPVPGVIVAVWDNLFSARVSLGKTDTAGIFRTMLDDGNYIVLASVSHFSLAPQEVALTVDGAEVVDITLESFFGKPPALPGFCRVWGHLYDALGRPHKNAPVAFFSPYAQKIESGALLSSRICSTSTDQTGRFWADLVKGITLRVSVEGTPWSESFVVPDADTYQLFQ